MSATTPRRTDMSTQNTPSKSPSRRVLGDLTPKAINTPSKQTNSLETSDVMKAHSPLKQVQTLSPHMSVGKENALGVGAFKAGKKRSIHEVDGAENVEDPGRVAAGRDVSSPRTKVGMRPETVDMLPTDNSAIDRGSSTEPDTPTSDAMEEVVDDSQASNLSFSNFVDWKECDSQPTDQSPPAPVEHEKQTRADLLRLRLGFANYKVKTNQVEKSGADILTLWDIHASTSTSSATAMTSSATSNQGIPSITLSPARRNTVTHVTANLDPGRPIPKLSGGPVLLPTAYSSRMIHEYQLPSSPPDSLPKCVSPEQVMSPTRPAYRTPISRRIRAEDDEEEGEAEELTIEERLQRQREQRFELGDLTSSVVKGNAAKGLLELSGRR